jgi:hypothetical protein
MPATWIHHRGKVASDVDLRMVQHAQVLVDLDAAVVADRQARTHNQLGRLHPPAQTNTPAGRSGARPWPTPARHRRPSTATRRARPGQGWRSLQAGGDPGQLSERLVVVVPVDQGQLHHGVVAQLGRKAQSDVQRGVARPSDYDPAATLAGRCAHASSMGIASPPARSAGRWPHLLAEQTGQRLGVDAGLEGEEAGIERFRLWGASAGSEPGAQESGGLVDGGSRGAGLAERIEEHEVVDGAVVAHGCNGDAC